MIERPRCRVVGLAVLILTSLAGGPKHGYALTKDIGQFAGVTLGPGTLYGAIARLDEGAYFEPEPVESDERRRPYRITGAGRVALEAAVHEMRELADVGATRLGIGVDLRGPRGAHVTRSCFERMIRWYPPAWRERYGAEMAALLEDRYATPGAVPWRDRMGLVRSGLAERTRATGVHGSAGPAEQVHTGSVLVLCGWALFLVAGAVFAKFADNWSAMAPSPTKWVAGDGYDAVVVLAALGCALVGLAALLTVVPLLRLVREGRWESVQRPVQRAIVAGGTAVVLFSAAVAWAHHVSRHDRNGGLAIYGALFVVVGLAAVAAVGCATAAVVSVARRIEVPSTVLRMLGLIALALSGVMALLLTGMVPWWSWVAIHAPGVLLNGIGAGVPYTSNVAPPTLVAVGVLLTMGLVLALGGSWRVARSWRGLHAA